jgi:cytochrome c-type biogenesis protein CcmH
MTLLLFIIFIALALAAIAFAIWPLLRGSPSRGRPALIGAIAALVIGLGIGSYILLGSPSLALRSLSGPRADDMRGLVAVLARRILQTPNDARGWMLLGRGYLSLNDPSDAAAAFKRALLVAPPQQRGELLSSYGEALSLAANGNVPPEAEAAFESALKSDPRDRAARFYLGQVAAQRGDASRALSLWTSLLAEIPVASPLHDVLLNRVAELRAGGAAPDINAMVEGLAARLKSHPDDALGWQRLVRAYSVLGQKEKAATALKEGRDALRSDAAGLAALNEEARNDSL